MYLKYDVLDVDVPVNFADGHQNADMPQNWADGHHTNETRFQFHKNLHLGNLNMVALPKWFKFSLNELLVCKEV